MIGRGCLGNPWIFNDILCHMRSIDIKKVKLTDIVDTCYYHIELLKKYKNDKVVINLSKKHLSYYLKKFNNSSLYRKEIMKSETIDEIEKILSNINQYVL
jgi:tRNA-dihydrouridine synthase